MYKWPLTKWLLTEITPDAGINRLFLLAIILPLVRLAVALVFHV